MMMIVSMLLRNTPLVVLFALPGAFSQAVAGEKPAYRAGNAVDRPALRAVEAGAGIAPLRVGRLAADGTVVAWRESERGCRGECEWVLVWDAFDPDQSGYPCCAEGCGLAGPTHRWFFGETYCNLYVTGDMQFDDEEADFAERLEIAWFWYVHGPGSGENCAIVVEFYEEFDDTCAIGDDGLGEYLGGVLLEFGHLESAAGSGYYFVDVDLCGLDWLPFDSDRDMAFNIWFATYDDSDPDTLLPATCAQPMLWGTNNPVSDGPGTQGPIQWNDDSPADWSHLVPDECDDYSGLKPCPDPLCAMVCFYHGHGDPGDPNCAGLSMLGILLADWGCAPPDDCVGDIDGDGYVGHADLGILLANWGWDCPDGPGCDGDSVEVLGFEVLEVDNTGVQPGDDPLAPEFAGGVSHFTFDLRVTVNEENDWTAAEMEIVFTEHRLRFFYHAEGDRTPNPVDMVDAYPAIEFDTLLANSRADADNAPPNADPDGIVSGVFNSTSLIVEAWFGVPPNGGDGVFTIARFTIAVHEASPVVPSVVPVGDGGDAPLLGTLVGTGMSRETWGDCNRFAFDLIVGECRGDLDGDYDIDQSDLGILLADWGCASDCVGDLDGDDDVDHGDLGILLTHYGQICW